MTQFAPPQARDLEEAVLGAIMLEKDALDLVSEIITSQTFYVAANATIYTACEAIHKRNEPVDILTVTQELKKAGKLEEVGGAYTVTSMTNRVASAANVEFHARIIQQKYMQRELGRISAETLNKSYTESVDVFELLSNAQFELDIISKNIIPNQSRKTTDVVESVLKNIKQAKQNQGILGPSTGLIALDKVLRGLRRKRTYVFAGRPAMGKTALVAGLAKALCLDQQIPVGLFSLEMGAEELIERLLSDLAEIDNNVLASGLLNEQQEYKLAEVSKKITNLFMIDDTPSITIQYLESKVRKMVDQGVQYIIIDYIQLMDLSEKDRRGKNREQELSYITKHLKRIAKKYNIGVIELSQLSRACEERDAPPTEKGRPQLSDLRESGAIEQDADVVILLYRPEYYNVEWTTSGKSARGLAELIVAKHRGGPCESVVVKYAGEFTRFYDLPDEKPDDMASIEEKQTKVHF